MGNIKQLQDVLTYHVASGSVFAKDISDQQMIKTVEGKDVTASLFAHRVFINKAEVVTADIKASNGVVHIIDKVLIPPQSAPTPAPPAPTPGNTIVDLAVATPDLSTLVTALKAGKLVDTLSGAGPFTVFAPTNEAFAALPKATLASLLDPKDIKELQDVLTYHVASGSVFAKDITDNQMIKTVEGKDVTASLFAHRVFINNAEVTAADIKASNGVVHIIDKVLIPATAPVASCSTRRDYSCSGQASFCQANLVRWCASGTTCDKSWTPAKGGTNPCVSAPAFSSSLRGARMVMA